MTQLTKLEFSPLATRYESTAIYENIKGQQFLIRVCGCDKYKVEESAKKLLVSLELSTVNSQEVPQNPNSGDDETTESTLSQEMFESPVDDNKQDAADVLEISVEVATARESKQPRNIKFAFANNIPDRILPNDNPQIVPRTNTSTNYILGPLDQVQAIITVTKDGATFSLWQAPEKTTPDKDWKFVSKVEVEVKPPNRSETKKLPDRPYQAGANKYFKLVVKGKTGTNYTVQGNWDIT